MGISVSILKWQFICIPMYHHDSLFSGKKILNSLINFSVTVHVQSILYSIDYTILVHYTDTH